MKRAYLIIWALVNTILAGVYPFASYWARTVMSTTYKIGPEQLVPIICLLLFAVGLVLMLRAFSYERRQWYIPAAGFVVNLLATCWLLYNQQIGAVTSVLLTMVFLTVLVMSLCNGKTAGKG